MLWLFLKFASIYTNQFIGSVSQWLLSPLLHFLSFFFDCQWSFCGTDLWTLTNNISLGCLLVGFSFHSLAGHLLNAHVKTVAVGKGMVSFQCVLEKAINWSKCWRGDLQQNWVIGEWGEWRRLTLMLGKFSKFWLWKERLVVLEHYLKWTVARSSSSPVSVSSGRCLNSSMNHGQTGNHPAFSSRRNTCYRTVWTLADCLKSMEVCEGKYSDACDEECSTLSTVFDSPQISSCGLCSIGLFYKTAINSMHSSNLVHTTCS